MTSAPTSRAGSLSGRIVFDNHEEVSTIDEDGTDLMRLTDSAGPDFDPSWSLDGTRIVFRSERSGDTEIWVMNADGSDQRRLAAGLSPAWSPNGSMIAYASPLPRFAHPAVASGAGKASLSAHYRGAVDGDLDV